MSTGASEKAGARLVCFDGNSESDFRVLVSGTEITPYVKGTVVATVDSAPHTNDTEQD